MGTRSALILVRNPYIATLACGQPSFQGRCFPPDATRRAVVVAPKKMENGKCAGNDDDSAVGVTRGEIAIFTSQSMTNTPFSKLTRWLPHLRFTI